MTDEQIKQNADNYTESLMCENIHRTMYSSIDFIAGAHSLDEEIKEMKKQLAAMTRLKNSFAGGVDILDNDNKELQEELDKLRNPWISVEEMLPAEFKKVIVMFDSGIIIDAFMTMVKDEPAWHPSVEIPIGSDVIFWMQRPEIKK